MRRIKSIQHEFVDHIPDVLNRGVLYVSIPFATTVHSCCCGCGSEVIAPLDPTDWEMLFDGKTVSLRPSIGNWGLPCQAHYWIRHNRVEWARRLSRYEIEEGRARDRVRRAQEIDAAPTFLGRLIPKRLRRFLGR